MLAAAAPGCGDTVKSSQEAGHRHDLVAARDASARAHAVWLATRCETIMGTTGNAAHREPWNKGKIVGQKAPFKQ